MDRAGLVGDDGPTHHGAFDIAYLSCIPNMVLLAPRDTTELVEMTHWMAGYDTGPTAVRYPRGSGDDRLPEGRTPIAYGTAEWLRKGSDVTIIALGSMVAVAWEAATSLSGDGIDVGVLNARFIKPLDAAAILAAADGSAALVTIEEGCLTGGIRRRRSWPLGGKRSLHAAALFGHRRRLCRARQPGVDSRRLRPLRRSADRLRAGDGAQRASGKRQVNSLFMSTKWKEGDRVRVVTRPVTDEDRKKNRYFPHMAGLVGTVQNVYDGGVVAVRIDETTLSAVTKDVHKRSTERMREKFLGDASEEAKKAMTKEELEFNAHFMQLLEAGDIEKVS